MKSSLSTVLMLLIFQLAAQNGKFNFGARSSGMAGASSTLGDAYSLFNNIGGLGYLEQSAALIGYQNRYGIPEFQVIGGGGVYHHAYANAGIGFFKFGDDLFSEQRFHLAIGHKIQLVSLGLGVDLIQYNVSTIGSRSIVALQFGGIAELSEQLRFGAHITNLNQANVVEETSEPYPTVMKAGVSYRPTSELMINVEVEKDLDYDEVTRIGLEYQPVPDVFLRTGISTRPYMSAFGIGFRPKPFQVDYSFSDDPSVGSIHEVSISYSIK